VSNAERSVAAPQPVDHGVCRSSSALIEVSAAAARRALLHAQQLLNDPSGPISARDLECAISQMGFVQVDTINVVDRAHELILASRFDRYTPSLLRSLLETRRSLFEHWTHDASLIPVQWFHHWKPRFDRYRQRDPRHSWWKSRLGRKPFAVIDAVRDAIAKNGPMMSREFEKAPASSRQNAVGEGWWNWKPHKAALEYLWRCGELTVIKRINFQKVYDLTERALPDHHAMPKPDKNAHVEWACQTALERLVFASPREVAAFWAAIDLPSATRWLRAAHAAGSIDLVQVATADGSPAKPMYALPDWPRRLADSEARTPPDRMRFINPFDPILRDRARAKRLFDFEFRFEAFVPAPKRTYGYYVMPLLLRDQLVGRCDAKFHRDRSALEIKGLWWESSAARSPAAARRRRTQFDEACQRLAAFIGATTIERTARA